MTSGDDLTPASNATSGIWPKTSPVVPVAKAEKPTTSLNSTASRRMRLHSVDDVKRELRRLYVEARNGTISTGDATKLAYLLNMLANLMVDSDLEKRVNEALGVGGNK